MNTDVNGFMNIIIFASGNGSNAENIIKYFNERKYNINWLTVTNKKHAGVIEKVTKLGSKIKIIFLITPNILIIQNLLILIKI